jgi:hypothetical protein
VALLTVVAEANGDLSGTYERVPSFYSSVGFVVPVQESFVLP